MRPSSLYFLTSAPSAAQRRTYALRTYALGVAAFVALSTYSTPSTAVPLPSPAAADSASPSKPAPGKTASGTSTAPNAKTTPGTKTPTSVTATANTKTATSGKAVPFSKAAKASTVTSTKSIVRPQPRRAATDYVLGPDDVLDIRVSNHPDLNGPVTVRPDGRITLDRAGEVMASGKTASTLAKEIELKLARTLNNARVQISVKQARLRQSRILGSVKAPGAYPLREGARLGDLIAQAGGLSTKTSRITGRLVRAGNIIPLQIGVAMAQPNGAANILLQSDDLIELSAPDFIKQLTVAGSVAHPGTYDLDEDLTVVGLLGQSGGVLPNAALKQAYVLRAGKPIPLDLTGADTGRSAVTFQFQVGDVLVVPENQAKFGVMGQVARAGYYSVPENAGEAGVLKALAQAGGATDDGDLSGITLTRVTNGTTVVLPVDAAAMLAGTQPDAIVLRPDDVLFVPKKRDEQVQVIGAVTRPGSYNLKEGMTLTSLLAEVGTPTNTAGLGRAYILRNGGQVPVDLRTLLLQGKLDDRLAAFQLRRGDVLVIPDVHEQVLVNGEVSKPGFYDLPDDLTMVSLLARAGNPTADASLSQAYVLRGTTRLPLDLRSVATGQTDPKLNGFKFEAGDTLVIPQNSLRYAVLGQVGRGGVFPYPEGKAGVSVLDALINAGGPGGQGAALNKAGIIRETNGKRVVIPVNLDELLRKGDAGNNITIQPRDVLYVPSRGSGGIFPKFLSSIPLIALLGGL